MNLKTFAARVRIFFATGRVKASPSSLKQRRAAQAGRRPDYFYLGPDVAMTRLADGKFIFVDPADESIAPHLIAHGFWEWWIHTVVCSLVKPGDHVLDVGANVGYYSLAMAAEVGSEGFVTALEANPALASLTRRSLVFNGFAARSAVIAKAASDTAGRVTFTTSRKNAGGGHLHVMDSAFGEDTQTINVEAIRLDDLGLEGVRFIRIDTEGSEPKVLRGAERLLQRPDVVVCMEWDVIQMQSRADVPEFAAWLSGQGFKFWRITYQATLEPVDYLDLPSLFACDIVMARTLPEMSKAL